jgi:D-aminopeptidase
MIVLATDAPLTARQLHRLCIRAAAGLARTGSFHGHSSGDFVIGFSTACPVAHEPERLTTERPVLVDEAQGMTGFFPAVVESVEEAVLNALWRAETVVGRDGHTRQALPLKRVAQVVDAWGLR